ncbi:hypothetical protein Q4534_03265 [Cyclobacterium sp. 1_MG-2023]|uniref:hypothetical protein n=1 Tax=Cyclobacterium sp. 1_MG-2023 TaxID=3062681 RepID=UPI0026E180D2|nr:hypothetical protein [Cyclobacterium sp. 1_MG-2023]MDO6436407.1 hypothetical protein [Cyclobacterium sp. 1_MG-2023]
MKKLIKKPVLLLGTLGALIGLGFVSTQNADVNAQGSVKWCDYKVDANDVASCADPLTEVSCICEDQC